MYSEYWWYVLLLIVILCHTMSAYVELDSSSCRHVHMKLLGGIKK
jgi:hypothetical protein